jgi:hypothetical protein
MTYIERTEMFLKPNMIIDLNEISTNNYYKKFGCMSWGEFYKKHYLKRLKKEFKKQNLYQKHIWVNNKKLILTYKTISNKDFNDCDIFDKIFNMDK